MNRVILMGRLTKDPDMRFSSQTNNAICRFALAVDRRFAKPGEEREADFFNIVAFGKTGEFCGKYFQKGMRVLVSGRLQNNNWEDQQGVKHYSTEVIADEAHFADSKGAGMGGAQETGAFGGGMPWNPGGSQTSQNPGSQAARRDMPPVFGSNAPFASPASPAVAPAAGSTAASGAVPAQAAGSAAGSATASAAASARDLQTGNTDGEEDGYFPMEDDDQLPF